MTGSAASKRVSSEERVFSLVLALVASPQGLTKSELLSSVYGYSERYDHAAPDASLERQFERDKTQMRQLGIPLETIDSPLESGNNQLIRYRISKHRLQLPEQVRFTADELMLLKLASLAWSEGSLGSASRWASMKLTSLGVNLDVRHLGIAPKLSILEPAAPALQFAINEGRVVHFDYQLPNRSSALPRRVAPLRLHRAEGRWHLIAYDLDREDDRIFLLSRIASEVRVDNRAFDPDLRKHIDAALAELLNLRASQRARVLAQRGSAAESRLAPRGSTDPAYIRLEGDDLDASEGDSTRIELGMLDLYAFAAELAGYGDEAIVEHPVALRDQVIARLAQIRAQHTNEGGGLDVSATHHS